MEGRVSSPAQAERSSQELAENSATLPLLDYAWFDPWRAVLVRPDGDIWAYVGQGVQSFSILASSFLIYLR